MKIVVIGHTGLLGSEILKQLEHHHHVFSGSLSNGVDIRDQQSFMRLPKSCDLVINCSGMLNCEADAFVQAIQINVTGALHVAEYATKSGAKLLHISSIFALAHPENQYFNGYGAIKKATEDLLQQYAVLRNLPLTVLRLPQLYDIEGRAKQSQAMLYRLIHQVTENHQATLHGIQNPKRNYMNIRDAAQLVMLWLTNPISGIFNCPHPNSLTIYELVEIIATSLCISPVIRLLPDKQGFKTLYIPQDKLIWTALKTTPAHSLKIDIVDLIEHRDVW